MLRICCVAPAKAVVKAERTGLSAGLQPDLFVALEQFFFRCKNEFSPKTPSLVGRKHEGGEKRCLVHVDHRKAHQPIVDDGHPGAWRGRDHPGNGLFGNPHLRKLLYREVVFAYRCTHRKQVGYVGDKGGSDLCGHVFCC